MPHVAQHHADATEQSIPPKTKWIILLLAAICTSNMVVGVSSIVPMLPHLAQQFSISYSTASYVIIAFTMPGIFFTPLAGIWADKYGRKAVLIPSLALFAVAGAACAFATSFEMLILFRFFQGMGAAPLGILNTAILGDTFSGRTLTKYIGYNMALLSVCTALYPSIGGFLIELNWSYPFFLPLMSIPTILLAAVVPLRGAGSPISFGKYMKNMMASTKNPVTKRLLCITFLTFLMLYGPVITCFPALTHIRYQASPSTTGLLMMLFSLGTICMSSQIVRLSGWFTRKQIFFASQVCYIIALVGIASVYSLQLYAIFPFLFLYGVGQGLNIPSVQNALLVVTDKSQRASVLALNASLLRTGQTISPFIFTLFLDKWGVNAPYWVALCIPLLILMLVYTLPPLTPAQPQQQS